MSRARILLLSNWYTPGFKGGGSQFAASNLVRALSNHFEFNILTRDRDFSETHPYPRIVPGRWTESEGARVRYLGPAECNYSTIASILKSTPHDLLHLNSVISLPFATFPALEERRISRRRSSILISPHGEMSPQARTQKHLRKSLYLAAAKAAGLFRRSHWHAASIQEEHDIKGVWGQKSRVTVAPLLPPAGIMSPEQLDRAAKATGILRLAFLSRIDRMKNLHLAIELVAHVPGVTLDIYGPISQADYWSECNARIIASGRSEAFRYCGSIQHSDVMRTLSGYDALILPSQSENFGYVVLESFAAGCPVVISDRTPWHHLKDRNIGFDIAIENIHGFHHALQRLRDMSEIEHATVRADCRAYASQYLRESHAKAAMIGLYDKLLQS